MHAYFTTSVGYIFIAVALALSGFCFSITTLQNFGGTPTADTSFYFLIMIFALMIMLPILTMKSFSEERKTKTEQLILTAPVSIPAMVFGKFLASYAVFGAATVFSSFYFLFLVPYSKLQWAILFGNLVALLLVGMVFISIGLFVSSLTENQLSAAIGTIAIILGFLGIGLLTSLIPANYSIRFVFRAISIFSRYQSYVNGYFEFATLIYYLSVSGIFLWLTIRVYDRRRFS